MSRYYETSCSVCDKKILRRVSDLKKCGKHFCSKECSKNRSRTNASCTFCGKELYRQPNRLERYKNFFCSRECQKLACLDIELSYSTHPNSKCKRVKEQRKSIKRKFFCKNCGREALRNRKFCSETCLEKYTFNKLVESWLRGEISGNAGVSSLSLRNFVIKYIHIKNNNACEVCGFSRLNKLTGKSLLEVHHLDGNASNSSESNLQLLCPICHKETPTYGSKNKRSARSYRRETKR